MVKMGGISLGSLNETWIESSVRAVEHPRSSLQNDLALLQLTKPLATYLPNVLPICLPHKDMNFDEGISYVSGWGQLSEGNQLNLNLMAKFMHRLWCVFVDDFSVSDTLQFVGLPIVNNTECSKAYKPLNLPIDQQCICAGYPEGFMDSCKVLPTADQ